MVNPIGPMLSLGQTEAGTAVSRKLERLAETNQLVDEVVIAKKILEQRFNEKRSRKPKQRPQRSEGRVPCTAMTRRGTGYAPMQKHPEQTFTEKRTLQESEKRDSSHSKISMMTAREDPSPSGDIRMWTPAQHS